MQIESMAQEHRNEITQLEQDNLELLGQVDTLNATLALVSMTLSKIVQNLEKA